MNCERGLLWLKPEGIVEIWVDTACVVGSISAWTDTSLIVAVPLEHSEGGMSAMDLVLRKGDVTMLYYWRRHPKEIPFDPRKVVRQRMWIESISGVGMGTGILVGIMGQPELTLPIGFSAIAFRFIAIGCIDRQFKVYRFKRRWVML